MDGASNFKGVGAGFTLQSLEGIIHERSIHLAFKASKNEAEYKALIEGLLLAKELGI